LKDLAEHVTLLFVAVSAADRVILEEEVFVMEKCALDYGIPKKEWPAALNNSFIKFFNEGDRAISNSILALRRALNMKQKKELVEDLLAIALADDILHEKEKDILIKVCTGFDVHLKVPKEFRINNK
jgi:uncharacterized tellurite resistance protein B-like protein